MVITWNGSDTFCPTQFVKAGAIRDWKLGVISRHLSHACELFEEVKEDISLSDQPMLVKAFGRLRDQTVLTQQIVGDKIAGQSHNIPPVEYHARKGSTTDLTYRITPGTKFVPMFRHDISTNPELFAPKTTTTPVAPPAENIIFPGFHPNPDCQIFTQDFLLPVEIFLAIPPAEERRKPQPPPATQPVFPTVTPTPQMSSRKPGETAPSSTPMPPPQQPVIQSTVSEKAKPEPESSTSTSTSSAPTPSSSSTPTPSSSSTYVKKFNCKFCHYSTDRKNDWENHCNRHTGHTFKCSHPGCKKVFSSEKNRTFHFKNVHMNIKRATCSVDTCNFQCNDFGKMRVHEYEEHGIGEECKCKFCGKKFNNFRVLDKHHKICQTEKDKDCPVCRKAYKSTERLVNHMEAQHSDKPRLVCESCGGVFISPDSLRVHKATQHK